VKLFKSSVALTLMLLGMTSHAADQSHNATKPGLLVYAAASLTNVMEALGKSYETESGQEVKFSFAASSTLAKQVEAGARADMFISADTDWADYLQSRNLLNADTRRNLLGNRLVLIAPADSKVQLKIAPNFSLNSALGKGRLSIGDPDSVPAGRYARAALTALNAWNSITDKLVLGDSVRTTLNFVATGAAPLGIVYETDALIDKKVRIVDFFPDNTHAAIVYPIALTRTARSGADDFLAYLSKPASQAVFKQFGFTVLP
jgi:molybdate transport system substrate-binding protein